VVVLVGLFGVVEVGELLDCLGVFVVVGGVEFVGEGEFFWLVDVFYMWVDGVFWWVVDWCDFVV